MNLGFLEVLQHPEHLVLLEHLWDPWVLEILGTLEDLLPLVHLLVPVNLVDLLHLVHLGLLETLWDPWVLEILEILEVL